MDKLVPESIKRINYSLEKDYGQLDNKPRWRVVWSWDQYETRYGDYEDRTPEGLLIRAVSEWRQVPKYKQYIGPCWMLERLEEIPSYAKEMAVQLSYEVKWAFLSLAVDTEPTWSDVRPMVDQVNKNIEQANNYIKYKDPDSDPLEAAANKEKRIDDYEEDLFGNETEVGDALAYRQGVGYTGPPKIIEVEKES